MKDTISFHGLEIPLDEVRDEALTISLSNAPLPLPAVKGLGTLAVCLIDEVRQLREQLEASHV